METPRTFVRFDQPSQPRSSSFQRSTGFIITIYRTLHEFSGPTVSPDLTANVNNFGALVRADSWRANRWSKFWLRVALAAQWERDPCIPLWRVFMTPIAKDLIPLSHSSFDPIAALLQSYEL